jgi:hypothetical protein
MTFSQLSGYDVLRHHAVLCIIVGTTSLHVMRISNYVVIAVMPVGNADLYIVLARCSTYFRVTGRCQLLGRCPGLKFLRVNIMAGPSKKMRVSDEEVLHEHLLQGNIVILLIVNIVVTVK